MIQGDSDGSEGLFRSRLLAMIDRHHELVKLAEALDWSLFEDAFGPLYHESLGRPGLPTRLMVGPAHYLPVRD